MKFIRKHRNNRRVQIVVLTGLSFALLGSGPATHAWADSTRHKVVARVLNKKDSLELGQIEVASQGKTATATAQDYF